jgi:hypothetical protein
MALRLRRGTDAERQLITPLEGELVYTTDTKLLYVGDGTTVGGTLVTGAGGGSTTLNGLTDTDLTGASNGDVLAFNLGTNKWEPAEVFGSATLDELTDTDLTGAGAGDVLAFNAANNKWEAAEVPGLSVLSVDDLADVVIDGNILQPGQVLIWDESGIWTNEYLTTVFAEQQNYKINIVGDDSTIIVNTDTNDVTGNFYGDLIGNVTGNVRGDVNGSVFGDDSTLLVDGINGTISPSVLITTEISSILGNPINIKAGNTASLNLFGITNGSSNGSFFNYKASRGTVDEPLDTEPNDIIAGFNFGGYYNNNYISAAQIVTRWDSSATLTNDRPGSVIALLTNNDTTGSNIATFDKIGTWSAPVLKTGTYTEATPSDTRPSTPTAGMIIFVSDATNGNRFQGWDSVAGAWVPLG